MSESPMVSVLVPADLASFVEAIAKHVAEFGSAGRQDGGASFVDAEQQLMGATARLEAACLGVMLASLDPRAPRVEVGGKTYRRLEQRAENTYYTLRGEVVVNRHLYREEAVRNGPTVVPVDLLAGIIDGRYTPAAGVAFARIGQEMPSRAAEAMCESLGVLPYSRSSHFRVSDEMGARWDLIREPIEASLVTADTIPDEATTVSVAVDRVSLPMAEPRKHTPEDIAAGVQHPIAVNLRMAYSAVWTLYDADGVPLVAVRYAHVPADGARAIEQSLRRDLDTIFAHRPNLGLVTLADGAPEMQNLLDRVVAGREVAARFVDFWHCAGHLGQAVALGPRVAEDQLADWKHDLLERDEAIDEIETELKRWAKRYKADKLPEALHEAITYIENNRERLRYATAHKAGLPIGSGTVEATGKTIVEVRMRRAGCRWTETGAQALLGLRALATSEPRRWKAAMDHVLSSYVHDVRPLPPKPRTRARSV